MSRVITGLGAPPAQPTDSSRPLTLSDRFAAIASQSDPNSSTAAGWQTTSYNSAASAASSHKSAKQQSASRLSNGAQSSQAASSAPFFTSNIPTGSTPHTTSPTKSSRPARLLKLKGGTTVSVGAIDTATATGGRKQRKILLQKEKRATTLEGKRQIVKHTKQPNNNNSQPHNKPSRKQSQPQPLPTVQPFTFVPQPFPSAFPAVATASAFLPPSAFGVAFHPGITRPPMQNGQMGRAGRGGVKAGPGGRVRGGAVQSQQQQQQQRGGIKGKRGKAAVGTVARVTAVVGQRANNGKGGKRKSGKGGKPGGAAGGGDVTSASLDSEMDLYHAAQ